MLAYYSMAVTTCRYSSYFGNPLFSSTTYLINDKQRFVLFPFVSSFEVSMSTQDFHLLQIVVLMDDTMFSYKIDSFILTYCLFRHQMNKIFLLIVLTLIFIILLTYGYLMTFQKPRWYSVTFLHLHYLILHLNFMPSFNYFTIIVNYLTFIYFISVLITFMNLVLKLFWNTRVTYTI